MFNDGCVLSEYCDICMVVNLAVSWMNSYICMAENLAMLWVSSDICMTDII